MAVNSDRDLATLFLYKKNFSCRLEGNVHYLIIGGGGGVDPGFYLFNIASFVVYCIDDSLRIVNKSLYKTASPFFLYSMVVLTS
jgi:hypothetical protein